MTLTASGFKDVWPEFIATDDSRVRAALATAYAQVNASLFLGELYDHAAGLLAAHALCVSPFGRPAKGKDSGRSSYLEEYERLARARCAGPWLVSQRYDGSVPTSGDGSE